MLIKFLTMFIFLSYTIIIPQTINGNDSQLGVDALTKGDYKKALEYFLRAYSNKEECFCNLPLNIGISYRMLGKYNEAISYLKKALDKSIQFQLEGSTYYNLGLCYEALNKHNEALKYFDKVTQYGMSYPVEYKYEKEGWFFVCFGKDENIYFQKKSLKKLKNGIIRVWTKWYWNEDVYSDSDYAKARNSNDYSGELKKIKEQKYNARNGVEYKLILSEYDCNKNKSRDIEINKYDKDGNLFEQDDFSKNNDNDLEKGWTFILPESVGEKILNKICK